MGGNKKLPEINEAQLNQIASRIKFLGLPLTLGNFNRFDPRINLYLYNNNEYLRKLLKDEQSSR